MIKTPKLYLIAVIIIGFTNQITISFEHGGHYQRIPNNNPQNTTQYLSSAIDILFPGQVIYNAVNQKSPYLIKCGKGYATTALSQLIQKVIFHQGTNLLTQGNGHKTSVYQKMLLAFTASATSAIIENPVTVIETYRALPTNSAKSNFQIYQELGPRKLMRGFIATAALKEGLFAVIYQQSSQNLPPAISSNITAAILATVCTQPGLVLRNQMQANPAAKTYLAAYKKIYQTAYLPGFFVGLVPRCMQVSVTTALYTAYTNLFQNYNEDLANRQITPSMAKLATRPEQP